MLVCWQTTHRTSKQCKFLTKPHTFIIPGCSLTFIRALCSWFPVCHSKMLERVSMVYYTIQSNLVKTSSNTKPYTFIIPGCSLTLIQALCSWFLVCHSKMIERVSLVYFTIQSNLVKTTSNTKLYTL